MGILKVSELFITLTVEFNNHNVEKLNIYVNLIIFLVQKISPEGKTKIQLQVVLHDGSASTFQFTNRLGLQAQIKDRDDVKELLVQLLPKFKRKIDRELEEKNRLLNFCV